MIPRILTEGDLGVGGEVGQRASLMGEAEGSAWQLLCEGLDDSQMLFASVFSKRKGMRTPMKTSRYDIHLFSFASPKFHEFLRPLKTAVVLREVFGWL